MAKIYHHDFLLSISKKKKGVALDLACGSSIYSKILVKNGWKVDCIDISQQLKIENKFFNEKFHKIDLQSFKNNLHFKKLVSKKYNLILLIKYTNRPLIKSLPDYLKHEGYIFCENFMVKKHNNRSYRLKRFELLSLLREKIRRVKFFQGIIKDDKIIQSAVFQK